MSIVTRQTFVETRRWAECDGPACTEQVPEEHVNDDWFVLWPPHTRFGAPPLTFCSVSCIVLYGGRELKAKQLL